MQTTNRLRRSLAVLGAAGVLTAGLAVPALAQDTDDTRDGVQGDTQQTTPEDRRAAKEERRAERQAAFAAELAAELDLPAEQVEEAVATVRERLAEERRAERLAALTERLDEAVADGTLTQEQADAILDGVEDGVLPMLRGWHARGGAGGFDGFGFGGFGFRG